MNNKGVSAVIGVILMVAITVAIAGTVYVYVSNMIGSSTTYEYIGTIDYLTEKEYNLLHTTDEYYFSLMNIDYSEYGLLLYAYDHNLTVGFSYFEDFNDVYVIESGTIEVLEITT
jgi:flagellin-like protein